MAFDKITGILILCVIWVLCVYIFLPQYLEPSLRNHAYMTLRMIESEANEYVKNETKKYTMYALTPVGLFLTVLILAVYKDYYVESDIYKSMSRFFSKLFKRKNKIAPK